MSILTTVVFKIHLYKPHGVFHLFKQHLKKHIYFPLMLIKIEKFLTVPTNFHEALLCFYCDLFPKEIVENLSQSNWRYIFFPFPCCCIFHSKQICRIVINAK